jgi:polysaccharide deacetylase family protein (PEP-CTERM system associated)
MIVNALSIDVEEYYHGLEFEAAVPAHERRQLPSRVEKSVDVMLDVLVRHSTRATFFIVGEVAEAHPAMVERMVRAGHEVACHSYRHELVSRQTPEQFRSDLRRAKRALEELAGQSVIGFRAPNYSIGPAQDWAYDVLLEEGFLYDSSSYPVHHDRYGDPRAPRFFHEIRRNGCRSLLEFPVATARVFGVNLQIGGGGFFRLFPTSWIASGLLRENRRHKRPVIFYCHPWELDPDQPRVPMPPLDRFRHYVNLARYQQKLESLLRRVPFSTARDVLGLG